MEFIDIYILLEKQSREQVALFREKYLYNLKQAAEVYEVPQYREKPVFSTDSVDEILDYLFTNGPIEYQLYWNNPHKSNLINGMIFFNGDGSLILGLSVMPEFEERFSSQLRKDFKSKYIIAYGEGLPPLERASFLEEYYKQQAGRMPEKVGERKKRKRVGAAIKLTVTLLVILFLLRGKLSEIITLRTQGNAVYKVVKVINEEWWNKGKQSTAKGFRVIDDNIYFSENILEAGVRRLSFDLVRTIHKGENRYIVKFFSKGNEHKYYDLYEVTEDGERIYFSFYHPEYTLIKESDFKYLLTIEECPIRTYYNVVDMYIDYETPEGEWTSTFYSMALKSDDVTTIEIKRDEKAQKILNITISSFRARSLK